MAQKTVQSMTSVMVDTSGLKDLAAVLRRSQPELKKQLYKNLRIAGEIVKEQAVFNSLWSSRIPSSLKVQGSGLHVKVVALASIAPNAGPLERGSQGRAGINRHPVFGNREVWVNQPTRPFLAPALQTRFTQVVALVDKAVDDALIAAGFND